MTRGLKNYGLTNVLIASDAMPTDRYAETPLHLSSQENRCHGVLLRLCHLMLGSSLTLWGQFCHVKLFICGFVFVGVQGPLGGLYMAPIQLNTSLSCTFIYVFILCPLLLCKSSVQSGNAEQCALVFTHLFVIQLHPLLCTISYLYMCLL